MDDGKLDALGQTIVSALPGAASGHSVAFDQLTVTVQAEKIVEVVKFLRDDPACRFVSIIDVTAVDYPGTRKALRRDLPLPVTDAECAHPRAR